ncbi:hypothetical protein [Paracoccus sp. T5]|uniref:hypothetical protein n=1 Tax=Paracoccus sp. T5 TaxID=3402161 RepID=UPI003AD8F998
MINGILAAACRRDLLMTMKASDWSACHPAGEPDIDLGGPVRQPPRRHPFPSTRRRMQRTVQQRNPPSASPAVRMPVIWCLSSLLMRNMRSAAIVRLPQNLHDVMVARNKNTGP